MPTIHIAGERLFYECPHPLEGPTPGARLLFLHGAGTDHRLFDEQLHFFAAAHTPIALDLPGHGHSPGEARDEVAAYREVIKAFVDILRLAPVLLCGHGLGGAIALDYAHRHSRDVEGLVLISVGITFPSAAAFAEAAARDPEAYVRARVQEGISVRARGSASGALATLLRGNAPAAAVRDLATSARWDSRDAMHAVETPTLVVFGEEDPLLRQASEILGAMPHAQFDTIPLARHYPNLEMPDIFHDSLNRFLTIVPDLSTLAGGE